MLTYETYLEAERTQQLKPFFQMLSTPTPANTTLTLPLFAILFLSDALVKP